MIFIDAREGLSGDMLLAAMLGTLDRNAQEEIREGMERASEQHGVRFYLSRIEEEGESGLAITYVSKDQHPEQRSWREAHDMLSAMSRALGSDNIISKRILDRIFEAEGAAHGVPPQQVHLHEIGRPQALLNIAGIGKAAMELETRGEREYVSSTITTGRGIVVVSHGVVRSPAPASQHLLAGFKHEPGDSPGERATPTGIAAVRVLANRQDEPPSRWVRKSVGFGTKRFGGRLGRTTLLLV